jgi:hypothetical protein
MAEVFTDDLAREGRRLLKTAPTQLRDEHIAALSVGAPAGSRTYLEGRRRGEPPPKEDGPYSAVVDAVLWSIKTAMKPLAQRIAVLERELASVKNWKFAGIWAHDVAYQKNNFVTDKGSLWICLRDTLRGDRPGGSSSWQLCTKRGADGHDAPGAR